ncbi:hypothetical protein BC826DRAFT_976739, partial [Russula brevipes]
MFLVPIRRVSTLVMIQVLKTTHDLPNPCHPRPTGQGIPPWQLKIEGCLLEPPNQRAKDWTPPRQLSTLIKSMVVELARDTALYNDSNIVEWHQNSSHPILDGFTIRRTGDTPAKVRLVLNLQQYPEQFRVAPEL